MPNHSPILLIEDDLDDQDILRSALDKIGIDNPLVCFAETKSAFKWMETGPQPFVILCDINLPAQNGIEFKMLIDNDVRLREKSIPFIFLTTLAQRTIIETAYKELTVQGFFEKPGLFSDYVELLTHLIAYWRICRHPNDTEVRGR